MTNNNKNREVQEIRKLIREVYNNGEEYRRNPKKLIRLFRKLLNYHLWREIYMTLIKKAIDGKTIYYSELAYEVNKIMGETLLPEQGNQLGVTLGPILGIISWYEYLCGRPLLSAIVIRKSDNTPGDGFWGMNEYIPKIDNIEEIEEEQKRVFFCWGGKFDIKNSG